MLSDLRFALRTLRRRRAFAAIAITTIALGIGTATAIYSVIDGVLFRPLPFQEPGRLVAIWNTYPQWRKEPILASMWDRISLSLPEFRDLERDGRAFTGVALWTGSSALLAGGEVPERVRTIAASASMLSVLGVQPVLGRNFLPAEDQVGGPRVTLLAHETWRSRYGGARDVLGRTVTFDGTPYTIIGVVPPGVVVDRDGDPPLFWVPVGQDSLNARERSNHSYRAVGRLRPTFDLAKATLDVDRILRGTEAPEKRGVRLAGWHGDQTRTVRGPLLLLLAAVGLLLVLACVNVATLLLGEAASREHEMGTRTALGASRGRIMRQLLTESVALSTTGAAFGILLAWWGTKALVALAPPRIPGMSGVHVDGRVLGATLVVTILTGILFGLAPALLLSRSRLSTVLRQGGGQSGRGRGALQRVLVGTEFALSVMLLVGAGLLARSLDKLTAVDPGFRTDRLLVARASVSRAIARDTAARRALLDMSLERLRGIAGVEDVTMISMAPFSGGTSSSSFELEGRPTPPGERHEAQQRTTLPDYFATIGIPLLAGRTYTHADDERAPLVVVISQSMAQRDWPGVSPIGARIKFQRQWRTVIGVVGDVKFLKLSTDDQATIYTPVAQRGYDVGTFVVRTRGDPIAMVPTVRSALHALAPDVPLATIDEMQALIRRSFAEERYRTVLISLFGIMAALLAAIGMYGVTARAVSRQTREIGIRVALGASRWRVVRLVVGHTIGGVTGGVVLGMLGAVAASKLLAPYLFGIGGTDPATYALVFGLLALVSLIASLVPARRAAGVDPAVVLRSE